MGKGTEILKARAESDAARVNDQLDGFSDEDLSDLAAAAVHSIAPKASEFFARLDPKRNRVLRAVMVTYLRNCANARQA